MTDDQTADLVKQLQDNAARLGLIWQLVPATVDNPTTPTVLFDSDSSAEPTPVINILDTPTAGERVWIAQVPPAGNYLIGRNPHPQLGTQIGTGGTLLTTTAEAAILSASWAVEPTFVFPPGRIFTAVLVGGVYTAAAADRICAIRLRKGAQTTAGTELAYRPWMVNLISGIGGSFAWNAFFKNSTTAAVSTKLSVTAVNPAGATGTVSLYGDTQQPLLVVVRDYCAISDDTSLAGVLASV